MRVGLALPQYDYSVPGESPLRWDTLLDHAHRAEALGFDSLWLSDHLFLDIAKYGRLLRSRKLVGVRGAGLPFDGLYYVKSVTHTIKRGEYKQSFTLVRNGVISTTASVPA